MKQREFKFRAWDGRDYEPWVPKMYHNIVPTWTKMGFFIVENIGYGPIITMIDDPKDQFKVMQYTALKDKNGTEIYEGDIVYLRDGSGLTIGYFPVVWDDAAFCLDSNSMDLLSTVDDMDVEVVGNRYENPELLK